MVVPVIGALIVGLMARYGSEKIRGHGIPEAIEAILLGRSRLDVKVAILKPLSSAVAIGTGGPFGAEGPIIMTGGAIGSLIAQLLPVSDSERKTLLVAGAAAGMTTVFGTPIAGHHAGGGAAAVRMDAAQLRPRRRRLRHRRGRAALAGPAVTAVPVRRRHGLSLVGLASAGCWSACSSGLLSGVLTQLVYACEDGFLKLPIHWMWWPMLGGVVVGIGGLIEPQRARRRLRQHRANAAR